MAFFIKTTEGLERLNGVYIKPSTAKKTITANGTNCDDIIVTLARIHIEKEE